MVKNSIELETLSLEWADKARNSISEALINFMESNEISFETLCKIMPIDEDTLTDIINMETDVTMCELSSIMIMLDLVAEIKPSEQTPIRFGTGTKDENIITEAKMIENEMNDESFGCGIIVSDNPRLKEALDTIVNLFETNPDSIEAFIRLFKKN